MVSLRSGREVGEAFPTKATKPRAQKSNSRAKDNPKVQEEDDERCIGILEVTEKMATASILPKPILPPVDPPSSNLAARMSSQKLDQKALPCMQVSRKTTSTPIHKQQVIPQIDVAPAASTNLAPKADCPPAAVLTSSINIPAKMIEIPQRPSTPAPRPVSTFASELADEPDYEKTPGRLGAIKQTDFTLKPDIKPFRGPKGQKERKSHEEKEEEYAQFTLDNEGHCFHDFHVCFNKGPSGSPTYDKSGFELDYDRVAHWMNPRAHRKPQIIRNMTKALDSGLDQSRQMADIFFEKGEAPTGIEFWRHDGYWKDRVSKDSNVPWHSLDVDDFREWEKRGYKKARKGEYETHTDKEKERMSRLLSGASLRK